MGTDDRHDALIGALARNLRPVRPLAPPWRRAGFWLLATAALGVVLAARSDLGALGHRMAAAPDLGLAMLGAALTAVLAAVAAFQTSVPDRDPRWAWLPLPAALAWIGASGLGCLRAAVIPDASLTVAMHDCVPFIAAVSLPLSLLGFVMLRRACPLRPGLTAGLGGLAAAAAAAALLNLFHPFDAAASDLAMHALAVGAVVLVNRVAGGRLLAR